MIARLLRAWRFLPPAADELVMLPPRAEPEPEPFGPLVLELEAGYPNGATGAILERVELERLYDDGRPLTVRLPAGADRVSVRVAQRAGLYAGATTTVERESEPPPEFLRPRILRGPW